ncbi:MAG: aldehyde ferredoxin oxidoreductase, partial [Candidatus Lokiarchaeota archaeon]|nr:aldehyde ferredoxin oxidoreductase [Candidatus Lokiarchaeota archaeon]
MVKADIGKILEIDLENDSHTVNKYGRENIEKFLGGPGYAINYLLDEKTYNHDPLDKRNVLALMTGLLTGTAYPCSGFYSVSARSPQTEIYGEGLSGGFFAAELRKIFNGIVFKNKSDSPKYLLIEEEHFELKDASNLWGLTTDKTIKELNSKHGKDYKIACIGPSGEKQVPLACIMNDHHRAVGRTGMGAIMGSKNIKAIAVKSSKKKIEYHD